MHFITSISLASSLIALSSAVPTLTERTTDFCPGQSHLTSEVKCSSGFVGCVAYDKGSEVCNGQKRFFNDCSGAPGLGSFFNCANGFKGCSANPRICDTKPSTSIDAASTQTPPSVPSIAPGTCHSWEGTFYNCANGFKGCSTDPTVCDPKASGVKRSARSQAPAAPGTCHSWEGTFYNCANGFKGCSTDPTVCDKPSAIPTTDSTCPAGSAYYVCASNGFHGCSSDPRVCDAPAAPTDPATKQDEAKTPSNPYPAWSCPEDTWYVRPNECSSRFVGCTSSQLGSGAEICEGEERFWGSCPPEHGNYYNCANGFVGCTTDVAICDEDL